MTTRCPWVPEDDALYRDYHDTEWGVPVREPRALWEKLILDGFQAGLSWRTILYKRENFQEAFAGFRPEVIASWGEAEIARLMGDKGIVRNRQKIEGTITNARAYLATAEEGQDFSDHLWSFFGGTPIQNAWDGTGGLPARSAEGDALAKDLKGRGFTYAGPTIVYAFAQAVGMVNDHATTCFRYDEVRALAG